MKTFKEYLNEKDSVYGVFAKTSDPLIVRALGRSGFDFVILDNEHGPNSLRDTFSLVMASYLAGVYPIVRVGKLLDIDIQRTLDLGIAGIQIPQIQSGEDAQLVQKYTKFFPRGKRGVCPYVAAADCGFIESSEYFAAQNEVSVIIHIEGVEGINNFESIIAVEDIDVIFIGPYDLSQSLGIPGQVNDPKLIKEIEKLVARCREENKHVGIFTDNVETAHRYRDLGVKYIAVSVDVRIFGRACSDLVEQLNER